MLGSIQTLTILNVPKFGQRTQAQVWLDVQFSDFHMLAGMTYFCSTG